MLSANALRFATERTPFRMGGVSLVKESIKHNRDGFELISSFRFPARSLVIVVEEMLLLGVV